MNKLGCRVLSVLIICFGILTISTPVMSAEDFDGVYSGTLSGRHSGPLVAIVSGTSIKFLFWSESLNSVDGAAFTLDDFGDFDGDTEREAVTIDGKISGNTVSGTWVDNADGGSFLGSKSTQEVAKYAGSYSGTYEGDFSGQWHITVLESGYLVGAIKSGNSQFTIDGGVNNDGAVIAYAAQESIGMYGTIVGSGISGKWTDGDNGDSGTFTSASSATDSDSETTTSGCFLNSIY